MKSFASLFVAFVSCIPAAGCSSPLETSEPGVAAALSTTPTASGSGVDLAHPSGAYSVHITATGTGCPKDGWAAALDDGGESIVVTYDDYAISADITTPKQFEECVLMMDLRTASEPASFALRGFSFDGRADVDGDLSNTAVGVSLYNWFQGNAPGMSILPRGVQLWPPYHDAFDYSENTLDADLLWSPCSTSPRLNVRSRFSSWVKPATPGLAASFGVHRMKWNLVWRTC
jgi:hypothetical protein